MLPKKVSLEYDGWKYSQFVFLSFTLFLIKYISYSGVFVFNIVIWNREYHIVMQTFFFFKFKMYYFGLCIKKFYDNLVPTLKNMLF